MFPDANFLVVKNTLTAFQELVAWHRSQFTIPVIGITGSNGKTIVKEWLYQLLHESYSIVRSPKSYNSQVGVPLSVWEMSAQHELGIFEAGISQKFEMEKLAKVIRPSIGVLTNIGEAHNDGFSDNDDKFNEKCLLFKDSGTIIINEKFRDSISKLYPKATVLSWGNGMGNQLVIKQVLKNEVSSTIQAVFCNEEFSFTIPFTDDASAENSIICSLVLLSLGISHAVLKDRILRLSPVNMRLELKKGINDCTLINDSYSADLSSLKIALNFLTQQAHGYDKTVILSDFPQSGKEDQILYTQIVSSLSRHGVNRLIGIGPHISLAIGSAGYPEVTGMNVKLFSSTEEFIQNFHSHEFRSETILIKGARAFGFEKIVQLLEQKVHETVLEINLNAVGHNLKSYQRKLQPSTKVMAMVKAFAYGSGGSEIARILQYHKVDYLGVAYADEGVDLRNAGITVPIMVMNTEESAFDAIIDNNLEPEIYSFTIMNALENYLRKQGINHYPVHIEIETGMNRLGFPFSDIENLSELLKSNSLIRVQSVFTHLAASEDEKEDLFTIEQSTIFNKSVAILEKKIGYNFIKHIANSAGALRHPSLQMDMVRLGIGLYGIDSASGNITLQTVASLKSTIAQIRKVKKGESVSYNRKGVIDHDTLVGTVRIGYADGYPRKLGNGVGYVLVNGRKAYVVGTVCMDMFMINLTGMPDVNEGDEVLIFGKELPVQDVARLAGTIPYEIMTGVSQRVKRVYFEE